MTEDPETIPRIYILMTEDPETQKAYSIEDVRVCYR